MKINVRELDDVVLTIIRKQAEVVLGCDDLSALRRISTDANNISDYENLIRRQEEQHREYYEQFIQQEIDRETYQSLKKNCAAHIGRLKNQLASLKQAERDKAMNIKTTALAKAALCESANPREIVDALIDKVYVSPENHVEIIWKVVDFATMR